MIPFTRPMLLKRLGNIKIPNPRLILTQKITTPLKEPYSIGLKILFATFIFLTVDNFFNYVALGSLKE